MTAVIVDGRAIAKNIQDDLHAKILKEKKAPRLDIVVVGENTVTATFVKAKARFAEKVGVEFFKHKILESTTTGELVSFIHGILERTNGVVVQLPLPDHVNVTAVLGAIPTEKDIDVLNTTTFERFVAGETPFVPPVAGAVLEIIKAYDVALDRKKVVVVGKGKLVGDPVRAILECEGARVVTVDSSTSKKKFNEMLHSADIIVSGAGVPNLIRPKQLSKGVTLIDAGTSSVGGTVMGDISADCTEVAELFSKTPGGVGPVTVAILFRNLVEGTYS